MNRIRLIIISVTVLLAGFACTKQQLQQVLGEFVEDNLTTEEVVLGLKEALIKGVDTGAEKASALNGFYGNPRIKIPFPQDVKKVESTLRDIGLGKEVDKFIVQLNRGAEKAVLEAKPIFVGAVKEMTIEDAWGILRGEKDAATEYLKRTTSDELYQAFNPIVSNTLDEVNATKYYDDIIVSYNKIPLVKKVNPDLDEYATRKTMDGIFTLIAQEEARIRENPTARTTQLLKKVFSQQ